MNKQAPRLQYTVRNVPAHIDRALRRLAESRGVSLNRLLLQALEAAGGGGDIEGPGRKLLFDDLDALAGTWIEDSAFNEAVSAQRKIDPDLWK
jgi:hypothetical protein